MKNFLATVALAAMLGAPAMAAEQNVWSTTFDTGFFEAVGPFPFSSAVLFLGGAARETAIGFPGLGTMMLRNATNGTTSFDTFGLGAHTHLRLTFDLAFIDSWDSTNGSVAPDILFVDIGGSSYQWTVNSASGTVFDVGPGTVISTGSNLGYSSWADTVVRYEFLLPHTGADFSFKIRAGGSGWQGGRDESWGIDNIALSAIFNDRPIIPEPATWALMIAGFGMVGSAMRRRRSIAA